MNLNTPNLTVPPVSTAAPSAKFIELARKIKEIEAENAKLAVKLEKSNQHLFRLQLERSILMDKLKQVNPSVNKVPSSDSLKAEIMKQVEAIGDNNSNDN